jgi:hypothetical protein
VLSLYYHKKESAIDMLNHMKNGFLCGKQVPKCNQCKNMGPFMQVKRSIRVTSKVYLGLNCKNASHHDNHENL